MILYILKEYEQIEYYDSDKNYYDGSKYGHDIARITNYIFSSDLDISSFKEANLLEGINILFSF